MHKYLALGALMASLATPAMAQMAPMAVPTTREGFRQMAMMSDAFEIATSQLALERSRNPSVRAYAEKMITDHSATSQALNGGTAVYGARARSSAARRPALSPARESALLLPVLSVRPWARNRRDGGRNGREHGRCQRSDADRRSARRQSRRHPEPARFGERIGLRPALWSGPAHGAPGSARPLHGLCTERFGPGHDAVHPVGDPASPAAPSRGQSPAGRRATKTIGHLDERRRVFGPAVFMRRARRRRRRRASASGRRLHAPGSRARPPHSHEPPRGTDRHGAQPLGQESAVERVARPGCVDGVDRARLNDFPALGSGDHRPGLAHRQSHHLARRDRDKTRIRPRDGSNPVSWRASSRPGSAMSESATAA